MKISDKTDSQLNTMVQINVRNIIDNKLSRFRQIKCCEYPLKFAIYACHCLISTRIIPKHEQPFWMIPI